MRTLVVVLLLATAAVVAAPTAHACTEDPCDPPPMPLCPSLTDLDASRPAGWLRDYVACVT